MGEHDGEFGAWAFHKKGNGGFTQVLARAATALGADIRLESPVDHVITQHGRATGVSLTDGTEFYADTVVSALDPRRTFLELVEPRELPSDLVESIERFRFQGTSSKVNFALDGLPEYPALPGRGDIFRGFLNVGPSIDYLEHAFDDGKYGWYSSRPYIDGAIQSTIDPDMAPPGKHVMSSFIHWTPYQLRESDWDTEKENLGDTVQRTLESFFPGFGNLVLQREVVTPLHIERTVGLSEGNIFAGEFLAPQMFFFRPAPGWSQYRTPIDGYYQCGSGTHPGGCVTGAPGKLAAGQILKDRAKTKPAPSEPTGRPGAAASWPIAPPDTEETMAVSPGELQLLRMTTDLRTQLMASLVDADLAFAMPGNPPLGDLCRTIGDTERAYIDSFRTGRMSWDVRNDEPGLDRSVERLRAWYAALDAELEAVLEDVPEEQFREGHIERDDGFAMPTGRSSTRGARRSSSSAPRPTCTAARWASPGASSGSTGSADRPARWDVPDTTTGRPAPRRTPGRVAPPGTSYLIGSPSAPTTNQIPPTPWPLVSPAAVSAAK